MGIYAVCIRKEIFKNVHNCRAGTVGRNIVFAVNYICDGSGIGDFYRTGVPVRPYRAVRRLFPNVVVGKCGSIREAGFVRDTTGFYLTESVGRPPAAAISPVIGAKMQICFRKV